MCGRFTLKTPMADLAGRFRLEEPPSLAPRYNIAPTQEVAVVRRLPEQRKRSLDLLRWGLIPSWARDRALGDRMINARTETVAVKPAFRVAFRRRRCLIPADGFYEWQRKGRIKQPYYIRMRDEEPFAFAGLWEIWHPPEGFPVTSCTILTTEANEVVRPVHHRMPVILSPPDHDLWLDPEVREPDRLHDRLRPYPPEEMEVYPVGLHVNHPGNDDPHCLEPLPGREELDFS